MSLGVIAWPKKQPKYCNDFCHESFHSFLRASWNLFRTSNRLPYKWHYLLNPQKAPQKSQNASRKPPRKLQKNAGKKSLQYFCCYFGQNNHIKRHFEINWPLISCHLMCKKASTRGILNKSLWLELASLDNAATSSTSSNLEQIVFFCNSTCNSSVRK